MKSLFIDTSNDFLVIILQKNNKLLDSIQIWNHHQHTSSAVNSVDNMLKKHKWDWFDINELYISIGPGSYVGIRVSLTMAKTMKIINDKLEVYFTNSLLLQVGNDSAVSIIDAKTNYYYVAVYDKAKNLVLEQAVDKDTLLHIKRQWKHFKVIEDYHQVDLVKNFLQIKSFCKKVSDVNKLKPLYLKELNLKKYSHI